MRVAIIGGGITGLSAAYQLAKRCRESGTAIEIVLYESAGRLGGKVLTRREPGVIMEGGPDSFLVRKPWMRELCVELGLEESLVSFYEGSLPTLMRFRGKLRTVPPGLAAGAPSRWGAVFASDLLSWRGKLRLAAERFVPPRRDGADETIAQFARRRLGREAAERALEPMLAGIYGGEAERLSILATFPALAEMERLYGSLWAGVRKARASRTRPQGGNGAHAGGTPPAFQTLVQGLDAVVDALVRKAEGVRFELGREVTGCEPVPAAREGAPAAPGIREDGAASPGIGGAGGKPVRYALAFSDGTAELFDRIIVAAPAPAAAKILAGAAPEAAAELRAIPYASSVSVYLAFRKEEVRHPLRGSGYLSVAESRDNPVRGTTWVSSKWPHCADPDKVLVRCHMGKIGGLPPIECDDDLLIREAREELRRVLGIDAEPVITHVFRWREAFPQYLVGHLHRVAAIERALPPGIWMAGAALRGLGLPDCVRQGRAAADQVFETL